jgi:hypothetical protein
LISTFGDEDDGCKEVASREEEDGCEEVDIEEDDGCEEVDVDEDEDGWEEVDVEEEEDGWEEEEVCLGSVIKLAEAVIMAKATRRTKGRQASILFPHVTSCI